MRKLSIAVVTCLFLWGLLAFAAFGQGLTGQPLTIPGGKTATVKSAERPAAGAIVRVLQRKKLGLTSSNVCRVLRDMKAAGDLDQYRTVEESGKVTINCSALAAAVADRLASESPEAWAAGQIDWDEILVFLEKLLELILKYLPLILDLFS